MKKCTTVIFILALTLVSTMAFGQQAQFKLDGNIGEAGFQNSTTVIDGIGGGQRIGFAIYASEIPALNGAELDMTWDSTKATFIKASSGTAIAAGTMTINGGEVTTTAEANVLTNPAEIVSADVAGHFAASYAQLGGSQSIAAGEWKLVYFAVFETAAGFTTDSSLEIDVTLNSANTGVVTELGAWTFYVNAATGVESKTWGEIKTDYNF